MSVQLLNLSEDNTTNLSEADVSTYMGSCQFISKIIPCSISTLLFRRYSLSEKYLKKCYLDDVSYVAFRSNLTRDHCAYKVHYAAARIKEAIQKKYLKEILLVIINKNTQEIIDQFAFKLKYLPETDGFKRGKKAQEIASHFFSRINQIPNKSNTSEHQIDVKLEYQFYENIPNSELIYNYKALPDHQNPDYMSIASVSTSYHKLGVFIALNNQQRQQAEEDPPQEDRQAEDILETSNMQLIPGTQKTPETLLTPDIQEAPEPKITQGTQEDPQISGSEVKKRKPMSQIENLQEYSTFPISLSGEPPRKSTRLSMKKKWSG